MRHLLTNLAEVAERRGKNVREENYGNGPYVNLQRNQSLKFGAWIKQVIAFGD